MAIITIAAPLSGIRGKLGGLIYSANATGPYVRHWSKPTNPKSTKQTLKRGDIARLCQAWRDLTAMQRYLWNIWAGQSAQELTNSLGETYYTGGFQWYVKINTQRFDVGLTTTRDDIPTESRPPAPTNVTFTLENVGGVLEALITFGAGLFSGNYVIIKSSMFVSKGQSAAFHGYRTTYTDYDETGSSIDFTTELQAIWGEWQEDQRCSIDVIEQRPQGTRGPATRLTVTVTA